MINKIFLGGTCAGTDWRDILIKMLRVDYFNPVVNDWTSDCIIEENKQKDLICNIHLYCITSAMKGVYSIAEVIDSVKRDKIITILHIIPDGFDEGQLKSLKAVSEMVKENGGISYIDFDLTRTAMILNYCFNDNYKCQ